MTAIGVNGAFVNVDTCNTIAVVASVAGAVERSVGICTGGVVVAIVRIDCTFVNVCAVKPVTTVPIVAHAFERAWVVGTSSILVAGHCQTLVNVITLRVIVVVKITRVAPQMRTFKRFDAG